MTAGRGDRVADPDQRRPARVEGGGRQRYDHDRADGRVAEERAATGLCGPPDGGGAGAERGDDRERGHHPERGDDEHVAAGGTGESFGPVRAPQPSVVSGYPVEATVALWHGRRFVMVVRHSRTPRP
ncbi:hypothetical protein AB0M79_14885 [Polymorphospora sp. NPDC051019]|uniref:hypothetical protein n=1 Tax=Polymorphospora sp. NPDC051019 TaxID=3155725 RepID=UPI00342377C2